MRKQMNLKRIVLKNKDIDMKQLREVLELVEELRKQGVFEGPGYNIVHPFERYLSPRKEDESEDPRTVQLRP